MQAQPQYARLNAYHGPKRKLLGIQAAHAPPAWRGSAAAGKRPAVPPPPEKGSKILLSQLPVDVGENEVEILFTKTVGPVKDVFIVYNSQGKSKGMAVVSFARTADAAIARAKYNSKIVDGRRPIKIEIVKDEDEAAQAPPKTPSLLDRLAKPPTAPVHAAQKAAPPAKQPRAHQAPRANAAKPPQQQRQQQQAPATTAKARLRQKKGPRRLKKAAAVKKTAAELDQEMEEYRASAAT
ncbi:hypothetical protein POSPLADRAFT_1074812 [Postia placenta MAD-698-R-SB12]|uniref:RRM domain-containing protein n=1 Tax=Postia placenta MAD-698-R-SB12 TaxID=670580 RepID=A0A1X6MXL2_9APHY|nr:hypothetical protein POSPLADRAFT_1074812 [Postia placenta MAD-698-R-SB12]OSX61079.1 hypothetical protein POSPLADRAFT_1074812 [Postia placenta MAD-698-R-SB12]